LVASNDTAEYDTPSVLTTQLELADAVFHEYLTWCHLHRGEVTMQLQVTSDPDSSANYSDQLELQTDSQQACLNSQLGFSSFAKLQKQHTEHHVEQTVRLPIQPEPK
jgi:hypothetical protein